MALVLNHSRKMIYHFTKKRKNKLSKTPTKNCFVNQHAHTHKHLSLSLSLYIYIYIYIYILGECNQWHSSRYVFINCCGRHDGNVDLVGRAFREERSSIYIYIYMCVCVCVCVMLFCIFMTISVFFFKGFSFFLPN